jgi:hypothetical protein
MIQVTIPMNSRTPLPNSQKPQPRKKEKVKVVPIPVSEPLSRNIRLRVGEKRLRP